MALLRFHSIVSLNLTGYILDRVTVPLTPTSIQVQAWDTEYDSEWGTRHGTPTSVIPITSRVPGMKPQRDIISLVWPQIWHSDTLSGLHAGHLTRNMASHWLTLSWLSYPSPMAVKLNALSWLGSRYPTCHFTHYPDSEPDICHDSSPISIIPYYSRHLTRSPLWRIYNPDLDPFPHSELTNQPLKIVFILK